MSRREATLHDMFALEQRLVIPPTVKNTSKEIKQSEFQDRISNDNLRHNRRLQFLVEGNTITQAMLTDIFDGVDDFDKAPWTAILAEIAGPIAFFGKIVSLGAGIAGAYWYRERALAIKAKVAQIEYYLPTLLSHFNELGQEIKQDLDLFTAGKVPDECENEEARLDWFNHLLERIAEYETLLNSLIDIRDLLSTLGNDQLWASLGYFSIGCTLLTIGLTIGTLGASQLVVPVIEGVEKMVNSSVGTANSAVTAWGYYQDKKRESREGRDGDILNYVQTSLTNLGIGAPEDKNASDSHTEAMPIVEAPTTKRNITQILTSQMGDLEKELDSLTFENKDKDSEKIINSDKIKKKVIRYQKNQSALKQIQKIQQNQIYRQKKFANTEEVDTRLLRGKTGVTAGSFCSAAGGALTVTGIAAFPGMIVVLVGSFISFLSSIYVFRSRKAGAENARRIKQEYDVAITQLETGTADKFKEQLAKWKLNGDEFKSEPASVKEPASPVIKLKKIEFLDEKTTTETNGIEEKSSDLQETEPTTPEPEPESHFISDDPLDSASRPLLSEFPSEAKVKSESTKNKQRFFKSHEKYEKPKPHKEKLTKPQDFPCPSVAVKVDENYFTLGSAGG